MANNENLKVLTSEEAREIGKLGGVASAASRKQKKQIREYLQILLSSSVGKNKDGEDIVGSEALAIRAFQSAVKGDWKAWELVRDTAGQKPIEKIMVADVDAGVVEQIESMVLGK
jgi:hypothetical protein